MKVLENNQYKIEVESGIIKGFYYKNNDNIADYDGNMGSVSYTLKSDSIDSTENDIELRPYKDRTSIGNEISQDSNSIVLFDEENDIRTTFSIGDGLVIESCTDNEAISQFGINLNMNFLSKHGDVFSQIMPSSPYSSDDDKYQYCIFTRPDGKFIVAVATGAVAWKMDYSPNNAGHRIQNFKFLHSFDKRYKENTSTHKELKVEIRYADTLDDVYKIIHEIYNVPYCRIIVGGNFEGKSLITISDDADRVDVIAPSGKVMSVKAEKVCELELEEYGFHKVIPYKGDMRGMDATIWNGGNMAELFDKSTLAIKKPYHPDDNLCEGGCFLWDMLANTRISKSDAFNDTIKSELDIIMDKSPEKIQRRTIVTSKTELYAPYHIMDSDRIQEQFFGVSILLEAYKTYGDNEYLEFAVKTLSELIDNWIKDSGMIYNGSDYTTVCAPVIAIADMYNVLDALNDSRAERFKKTAITVADFLVRRGLNFPTEGSTDEKYEDGSISCTALSVLYVCKNVQYNEKYISFAKEVLQFHNAWCIYSPDVKMNQSSFRWWETIWEGDGQGPAICAGHAWTIWRAEALYLYGILASDQEALLSSWNGFMTNFCKTQPDGTMYACYEADYIRRGGYEGIQRGLKQLGDADVGVKYCIAHSYPNHVDNSLSRYAWVRNAYSWLNTAAVLSVDGKIVVLNGRQENNDIILNDTVENVYINDDIDSVNLICKADIKIISTAQCNVNIKKIG